MRDSQLVTRWPEHLLLQVKLVWPSSSGTREQPPISRRRTLLIPLQQFGCKCRVKRKLVFRGLCLGTIYDTAYNCSDDSQRQLVEVEVFPLERQNLTRPQSSAERNKSHRPVRLPQSIQDL